MCCFSGVARPVGWLSSLFAPAPLRVADTEIFARRDGAEQVLVYSMRLSTAAEVAMILPLPVRPGAGEDQLRFVNLEDYPALFEHLRCCFEPPAMQSAGPSRGGGPGWTAKRLVVHKVGSFEASFVPSLGDFSRLDPRFRMADDVWAALPQYADHGFAVFKLAPGKQQKIHPMAFRFPTRDPERLFFPTVHIHDGRVHAKARFDHTLYFQGRAAGLPAVIPVETFVRIAETKGLVDKTPLHRSTLRGRLRNQDTWI